MSLKAFHLVFVTAAIAMSFGCSVWGLKNYWSPGGAGQDLAFGAGAFATALALIVYERLFVKKIKQMEGI